MTVRQRLYKSATTLVALVAIVASVGASAGQIWGLRAPELALKFWPTSSTAEAQYAAVQALDPDATPARRGAADALARTAIARDPTNVVAIRTRGLLTGLSGDGNGAARWMRSAESVSRRDLPTQLWFIEEAVGRGNIDQALVHYDRALRTSRSAVGVLFPVLIAATAEPEVADKLSRLMAGFPNWWGLFMHQLIGEAPHAATLAIFAQRLHLSPTDRAHPDFFPRILQRLVAADEFKRADGLYRSAMPGRKTVLYDGDFEERAGVLPFAWRLADEGELGARVEARPDGDAGSALFIDARNGRSGEVASQALALAPGRYVLHGVTGQTGSDEASRPVIRLRCGSMHPTELAMLRLPPAAARAEAISLSFTVPAGCPGAWVSVEANAGLGGDDERPWIDKLTVTRAGSGAER